MKYRLVLIIGIIPLLVLTLGLACAVGIPAGTNDPGEREGDIKEEQTGAAVGGVITDVDRLDEAVVLIEVEGSYIDPFEGWQVNAGNWGTGFIIDPQGIAVTNNHVVTGASKLEVWLQGEDTPRNARVLGVSECYDLAVIDIDGEGFPYVDWYDEEIKAGLEVFSAGFPSTASAVDYTLTEGIVSKPATSLHSDWASVDDVIGHTAKMIGGNSGGPLVNESAEVVGVNYAGVDITDENYAISREIAIPVIEKLRETQDVDSIGINGTAVSGELFGSQITGLWIRSVKSGTPADNARIQAGDILLEIENQVLNQDVMRDYCDVLQSHITDDTLAVTVLRSGTGEVFNGQLNGRELEYAYSYEIPEEVPQEDGTELSQDDIDDGGTSDSDEPEVEISENVFNENVSEKGDIYYLDYFNAGMEDWEYFLVQGEEQDVSHEAREGVFHVELTANDTFLYYMFKGWDFNDIRLDSRVENLGETTNNVGLVCRVSDDGWYEANILGNGDYFVYRYDTNASEDKYMVLESGNSIEINTGTGVNDLTLICQGSQLSFGVNGIELVSLALDSDGHEVMEWGQVGMTVASEEETPVIVDFQDFIISLP